MTLEELLQHDLVSNLDIRWTPEDKFTICPFIYIDGQWSSGKRPEYGRTLQEAVDRVAERVTNLAKYHEEKKYDSNNQG